MALENGASSTRHSRRRFLYTAAIGTAGSLLAACTPAAPAAPTAAPAKPVAKPTSAPAAKTAAQPTSAPVPKTAAKVKVDVVPEETPLAPIDEVRVGLGADLVAVSPFFTAAVTDKNITKHFVGGLTRINENAEVVPLLAESWSLVQPDTWQFKLRQNTKFHNGQPFTAEAVKTIYEYMMHPDTKASQASTYRLIKEVNVVDDHTVNLVTQQPSPILHRIVSDLHIMEPNDLREKGPEAAAAHPIGAGPYKFVEWVKGQRLVLEANNDYFAGPPAIKKIIFRPITEDGSRISALLAGELDLVYNVPTEMVPQIQNNLNASVKSAMTSTVYFINVNTLIPELPVAKTEVRQAISHAIDRQGIIDGIMGGVGAPVATLFHNNSFGLDKSLEPYAYDPEKAKQLLSQAGYPNGFSIKMLASQGRWPKDREVAQVIAAQLGQVGINIDLEVLDYTTWLQRVQSKQEPIIASMGWSDPAGDPNAMLNRLHTCEDSGSPWSQNCIPQLDALVKASQFEMDPAKRAEILQQAQEIMYREVPNIGLFQVGQIRGVSPKVADWYTPRSDEGIWLYYPTRA